MFAFFRKATADISRPIHEFTALSDRNGIDLSSEITVKEKT